MKSLKYVAIWWQNSCVPLTLDTTLTISFLVSDISLEGSIKVKILVFFMPNHFQQIMISNASVSIPHITYSLLWFK